MKRCNELNILHLNTEKTWRGGERQVYILSSALKKLGHGVHIICKHNTILYKKAIEENINVFTLPLKFEFDLYSSYKIAKYIKKENINILHAHTPHAHSLAILASYFLRKRIAIVVHRRVDFHVRQNFINRLKYNNALVNKYIAISNTVKEILQESIQLDSSKVEVIYSAVDVDYEKLLSNMSYADVKLLKNKEDNFLKVTRLCIIGHLAEHKGHKYLLDAMPIVLKKYPNTILNIVGSGECKSKLIAKCEQLGLSNKNIQFSGFISEMSLVWNNIDILVVASVQEGLNTSILDAIYRKIPIVTTDAGGIKEILSNKNSYMAKAGNSSALADAIIMSIDHPKERAEKANIAFKELGKNFTVSALSLKTVGLYRKLLNLA